MATVDYTSTHQLDFYIEFVDGKLSSGESNDVVCVVVNGGMPVCVGSWETIPAYTTPRAVDAVIFRPEVPGTSFSGGGFFFDNIVIDNAALNAAGVFPQE